MKKLFKKTIKNTKLYNLLNSSKALYMIHLYLSYDLKVLVHCSQGIQRSCAVVACYLVKYKNMDVLESINFIKQKRPIAFFGAINFLDTINIFARNARTGRDF